ncbi:hypothetical protein P5P86_13700 [Nocardioides sp. BP30]|uniref:hypothetical protein n=1 Tax=Nocardioides sp. BP30 TaxID=3036374 RepID=UPI002468CC62|nr:hypothetical protein [Nocardioides sp. BP30]WGL51016.1 hypothetical protein P5P86_13700 [Nocardioides sp. BP30]
MSAEVTTYRYVRFALLALLLALTVSVGAETVRSGWQTSLSAYYYTAAGPVFVGALTAVGVCLIALRGFTDAEDVLLNLAGISAPMVAFVPTPEAGRHPDVAAVENSALTFLAVLALGYVVVLVVGLRRRAEGWPTRWGLFGLIATALAWVVGIAWILLDRRSFAAHAHALAAVATFVPFAGVVVLNTDWGVRVLAGAREPSRTRFDAAYWGIGAGMVVAVLVFAGLHAWTYALLGLETALLALFGAFWVLQTIDLFDADRDLARCHPAGGDVRSATVTG